MNSSFQAGGNNTMENKKTTELLDLLKTLIDKDGNLKEGYREALDELKTREPFDFIFADEYANGESLEERIGEIEAKVKKLKRHKHDEKSGDVLIRI